MLNFILKLLDRIRPAQKVYAHCDIPCGIYDPHQAQLGCLTIIRMIDLISGLDENKIEHGIETQNSLNRFIMVKEEHAEAVKREIRVIWGDHFKIEHRVKYPELDGLVHEIMKLASTVRQNVNRQSAEDFLEKVNRFAEIFWATKGIETFRAKAPYKPETEAVYPKLNAQ